MSRCGALILTPNNTICIYRMYFKEKNPKSNITDLIYLNYLKIVILNVLLQTHEFVIIVVSHWLLYGSTFILHCHH